MSMSSVVENLRLAQIRTDGGTQPRMSLNESTVAEYQEALTDGAKMPPVTVFHDGVDYWLADGFHRFFAHKNIGALDVQAEVHQGTKRDAILHSVGANASHGLRRTNDDKRKAAMTLLEDSEWGKWSDREIARVCGVSNDFVSRLRKESLSSNDSKAAPADRTYTTKHGTEAVMNTANIGKKKADSPVAPPTEKNPARTLEAAPLPEEQMDSDDELAEAHHTIADLASEVDQLRDQLAIKHMDASEAEKQHAAGTIADLRKRVRDLELELDAVKASRDTYMRENEQLKIQCNSQRRALQKLQKQQKEAA